LARTIDRALDADREAFLGRGYHTGLAGFLSLLPLVYQTFYYLNPIYIFRNHLFQILVLFQKKQIFF